MPAGPDPAFAPPDGGRAAFDGWQGSMKPEGRRTIMGGDGYLFGFQSRASFCASLI